MAFIFDYTFNKTTRLGDDSCDQSQKTLQNSNSSTYTLNQYRPDCPMKSAFDLALSQPAVNYSGSHQVGINGCNIDESSNLSLVELSRDRSKLNLFQRTFSTVPFLGRGKSNPVLESQIQQGDMFSNRKSVNNITEMSFSSYSNTPMIPTLKATINNPANLIEGVAAEGWIRGGLPSRELVRDKEYTQKYKGASSL